MTKLGVVMALAAASCTPSVGGPSTQPPANTSVPPTSAPTLSTTSTTEPAPLAAPFELSPIPDPLTYNSPLHGFTISYPGTWSPVEHSVENLESLSQRLSARVPGESSSVLAGNRDELAASIVAWFQAPGGQGFADNLQILRTQNDSGATVEIIARAAVSDLQLLGLTDLAMGPSDLTDQAAVTITSKAISTDGNSIFQASVFIVSEIDGDVWVINYATGDPTSFGLLRAIVESFQLNPRS